MLVELKMQFDSPEFKALERVSVLVRHKADWDPRYSWTLGRQARIYADRCTVSFRAGLYEIIEEADNRHALSGWVGENFLV